MIEATPEMLRKLPKRVLREMRREVKVNLLSEHDYLDQLIEEEEVIDSALAKRDESKDAGA